MAGGLVYADGHVHSNPVSGLGADEIGRKFASVGGWFMALVILPPWHYGISPRSLEDYKRAVDIFLSECRRLRQHVPRVACLAGFHPAEVDKLTARGMKLEDALQLGLQVVDYAARLCRDGVLDGIGEVGRQHYKTTPERLAAATSIMVRALEHARDHGCILHLHLENAGRATVDTVEVLRAAIGAPRERILFHHASSKVAARAAELGYPATVPGKREQLLAALSAAGPSFIPESDYIDDPRRPCVSSCPWEIVERQQGLLEEGLVEEETLYRINVDNVVKLYGVEPP